jgi:formate C-acetyltransferase
MGEWMALGFYEASDLPWPRSYGRAFRRLYENMEIRIPDDRLLAPWDPFPVTRTQASHGAHHATGFICDFMHNCGIHVNDEVIPDRKRQFPQHAQFIDDLAADLRSRLPHFGGYTHCNPDVRRVVADGFDAMERGLDEQIAAVEAPPRASGGPPSLLRSYGGCQPSVALAKGGGGEPDLLASLKEYAIGVRAFHSRTLAALRDAAERAQGRRTAELALIADSFEKCALAPATTFVQGILAVHFVWLLDGCDSIGRVDQVLGPLFERDTRSGRLEIGLVRRLLDELFENFERLNGWNLQIGGRRPDGANGWNALTHELVQACGRNTFRRPNVALRVTADTSDAELLEALDVLREGTGRPALYNDDLYVRTLLGRGLGLSPEDARDLGFGGCTETMIPGMSNVGSLEGDINLAKALELAIHDGHDPLSGRQRGLHTGRFEDFADFDAFMGAVQCQIKHATDEFVAGNVQQLRQRFTRGDPKLCRTFFTRDCVARRRSFEAGGARYNWSIVNYAGIANLIDGLAAVCRCVFDEGSVTAVALLAALADDFAGDESVRRRLLDAPKFGNDDPYVDDIGRRIMEFAWEELRAHEHPRGGRYLPACLMFATYGYHGSYVGALPDGRKARAALADSSGPMQGRDTHGPTAMLKSVARLPLSLAVGTPVLNIRFQKRLLSTRSGLETCADLVRTFFGMGGMQIQVSVVSTEDMRAAQDEPEKHRDLIVRIGGYSEYFTRLDRALQDSVIARTEHAG